MDWKEYLLQSSTPVPVGYNLKIEMSAGGFSRWYDYRSFGSE